MTTTPITYTPAGWYADPQNPNGKRYWDGQNWTEQTAVPAVKQSLTAPIIIAILLPLVGVIWGIVMLTQRDNDRGLPTLIVSIVAWVLWFALFSSIPVSS